MNDTQLAAQNLAIAIARLRLAERDANQALIVADCQLRNLANRTHLDARVAAATARVEAGFVAGTARLGN